VGHPMKAIAVLMWLVVPAIWVVLILMAIRAI
jgi:hypothetical protein